MALAVGAEMQLSHAGIGDDKDINCTEANGKTGLLNAIEARDLERVFRIIRHPTFDPSRQTYNGEPIIRASIDGLYPDLTVVMVAKGFSPLAAEQTPWNNAVAGLVFHALEHADAEVVFAIFVRCDFTTLGAADCCEMWQRVCCRGVGTVLDWTFHNLVNQRNVDHTKAFVAAMKEKQASSCVLLLKSKLVDITERMPHGFNVLGYAVYCDVPVVVEYLLGLPDALALRSSPYGRDAEAAQVQRAPSYFVLAWERSHILDLLILYGAVSQKPVDNALSVVWVARHMPTGRSVKRFVLLLRRWQVFAALVRRGKADQAKALLVRAAYLYKGRPVNEECCDEYVAMLKDASCVMQNRMPFLPIFVSILEAARPEKAVAACLALFPLPDSEFARDERKRELCIVLEWVARAREMHDDTFAVLLRYYRDNVSDPWDDSFVPIVRAVLAGRPEAALVLWQAGWTPEALPDDTVLSLINATCVENTPANGQFFDLAVQHHSWKPDCMNALVDALFDAWAKRKVCGDVWEHVDELCRNGARFSSLHACVGQSPSGAPHFYTPLTMSNACFCIVYCDRGHQDLSADESAFVERQTLLLRRYLVSSVLQHHKALRQNAAPKFYADLTECAAYNDHRLQGARFDLDAVRRFPPAVRRCLVTILTLARTSQPARNETHRAFQAMPWPVLLWLMRVLTWQLVDCFDCADVHPGLGT